MIPVVYMMRWDKGRYTVANKQLRQLHGCVSVVYIHPHLGPGELLLFTALGL